MKEKIERVFKTKVLCMFLAGSHSYGTNDLKSDKDIIVVTEGNRVITNYYSDKENKVKTEYFVMGREYFKSVHEISDSASSFIVVYADNILGVNKKEILMYLDETYKDEFYQIVNEVWDDKLAKFLHRFVSLFRARIGNSNQKRLYHIYRLRAMIAHLERTGKFDLIYDEPYKSRMENYKRNYSVMQNKTKELNEMLDYIELYAKKLEV